MVSDAGQSLLVGRLSLDRTLARQAAFALFVRVFLEQSALVPHRLVTPPAEGGQRPHRPGASPPAAARRPLAAVTALPDLVGEIAAANPFVVAPFVDPSRRAGLATLDPEATGELLGWLVAQRVGDEEPQVAYELGMLALGVDLPAIMVRALRQAPVGPTTRVAELPDGAGYAAIFLARLHPDWPAATRVRLFTAGEDATQLAGWAMLLLSRTLEPPPDSICRIPAQPSLPLTRQEFDLALVYNPIPALSSAVAVERAVVAESVVVV